MSSPPIPLNPYAAPAARVDDAPVEGLVKADRATRFGAAILDALALGVPAGVMGVVAAMVTPALGSDDPANALGVLGLLLILAIGTVVTVNLVLLHRHGQTIGKRVVGIRVVRSDGTRCDLWRIIVLRWMPVTLLGAVPWLGMLVTLADLLVIFREDVRCAHDHLADTIVVRA